MNDLSGFGAHRPLTLTVGDILSHWHKYDLNPPYQRGEVWKEDFKQNLILSILDSIPINVLHVVQKCPEDSNLRWVLDGKQRIQAMLDFASNDEKKRFKIPVIVNGEQMRIGYEDIINPTHPAFKLFYSPFHEFQIEGVLWAPMSYEMQKKLFGRINNSVTLDNKERRYCSNFLCKKLFQYLRKKGLEATGLNEHFRTEIKEDKRYASCTMIHSILLHGYGESLSSVFCPRTYSSVSLKESAELIDQKLAQIGFDATKEFSEDFAEKAGITNVCKETIQVFRWIHRIINHINWNLKKNIDSTFMIDLASFFIKKLQEGILTTSYVEQNTEELLAFAKSYQSKRTGRNNDFRAGTTEIGRIRTRFDTLEVLFQEHIRDTKKKGKGVPDLDDTLARLSAPEACPISGQKLTNQNTQIDHNEAAAVSSSTVYSAVSDIANRRKSDLTSYTLEKTKTHIESIKS